MVCVDGASIQTMHVSFGTIIIIAGKKFTTTAVNKKSQRFESYDVCPHTSRCLFLFDNTVPKEKQQQQQQNNNNGGVLFQEPNKEIVYYSVEKSGNANSTASSSRIVHIAAQPATQTAVVTLCMIASTNKYMREVQLPQQRELDGIARRAGFVLGLSPHSVRARTLFLPPRHVDGESLERLHQMMGGVFVEEFKQFAGQYTKELGNSAEEEDYKYQRKNLPQEEWLAL
eukprot:PhF_6_TR526/c1_g1_i1/m.348